MPLRLPWIRLPLGLGCLLGMFEFHVFTFSISISKGKISRKKTKGRYFAVRARGHDENMAGSHLAGRVVDVCRDACLVSV
jgi:hypothetical protein